MFDSLIDILKYNPDEPLIFSSGLFLFLFLGFSFVYVLLQRQRTLRLLFVTAFSYYFYYKSSGLYFVLLAIVTVSDYLIAAAIWNYRQRHPGRRLVPKLLVGLSLCVGLGMLGYFKYTNFFAGMIAQMIGSNFQPWDIFLPVGISFFTFQSLSYTIDVYRGELKPLRFTARLCILRVVFPSTCGRPHCQGARFCAANKASASGDAGNVRAWSFSHNHRIVQRRP